MGNFGDLLSKSWKEYKSNFWLFFKIFLLFGLISSTIYIGLIIFSIFWDPLQGSIFPLSSVSWPFLIISFLVLGFFGLIMNISYISISIFKENTKMSFGKALKGGLSYFWKYLGLFLLLIILLIPLFVLLIIPEIIFSIYWSFSIFVLMRENTSIWQSMKRSKLIVKGR